MLMASPVWLDMRGTMAEGKKEQKVTIILTMCDKNILILQILQKHLTMPKSTP